MFCIHNCSKQSGTKRCFTNAILTAGKAEKDLYLSNSFPVWNKMQPGKHPEELFITALTRGNACFIPRESSQTPNIKTSGFGSPLQAFVFIPIWKISGLSCVPTNWFHAWTHADLVCVVLSNSRSGSVQRCVPIFRKLNQRSLLSPNKQTLLCILHVSSKIWAFQVWQEWFMGGSTVASLSYLPVLLKISCIWTC